MRDSVQDRLDDYTDRVLGFSGRLRACLTQRGHAIIPAQIARDITASTKRNTTSQTVSNWVNAVQMPMHANLLALAEWLGTTPESLTEGTPLLHFAPPARLDIDQTQALEHFGKLDPYGRRCALAMLAGLARLRAGAA